MEFYTDTVEPLRLRGDEDGEDMDADEDGDDYDDDADITEEDEDDEM